MAEMGPKWGKNRIAMRSHEIALKGLSKKEVLGYSEQIQTILYIFLA